MYAYLLIIIKCIQLVWSWLFGLHFHLSDRQCPAMRLLRCCIVNTLTIEPYGIIVAFSVCVWDWELCFGWSVSASVPLIKCNMIDALAFINMNAKKATPNSIWILILNAQFEPVLSGGMTLHNDSGQSEALHFLFIYFSINWIFLVAWFLFVCVCVFVLVNSDSGGGAYVYHFCSTCNCVEALLKRATKHETLEHQIANQCH